MSYSTIFIRILKFQFNLQLKTFAVYVSYIYLIFSYMFLEIIYCSIYFLLTSASILKAVVIDKIFIRKNFKKLDVIAFSDFYLFSTVLKEDRHDVVNVVGCVHTSALCLRDSFRSSPDH